MIRSMTGYGRAVRLMTPAAAKSAPAGEGVQLVVEITSVNRKNLDVAVSLPRDWQRLEPELMEMVKRKVQRGRINVSISTEAPAGRGERAFNAAEVDSVLRELEELSRARNIPFQPDLALLFSIVSSTRSKPVVAEAEEVSAGLLEAMEEAMNEMVKMRAAEGDALRRDLGERKAQLEAWLHEIRQAGEGVVPEYRETLLKRLRQSGLEFSLEDDRVLKEIALFADRADISEEVTRIESHFLQFEEFLKSAEPVGRKLEFLLQEIGREFNTIGSKAADSAISRLVIESKNELERIREQIQNVE